MERKTCSVCKGSCCGAAPCEHCNNYGYVFVRSKEQKSILDNVPIQMDNTFKELLNTKEDRMAIKTKEG